MARAKRTTKRAAPKRKPTKTRSQKAARSKVATAPAIEADLEAALVRARADVRAARDEVVRLVAENEQLRVRLDAKR